MNTYASSLTSPFRPAWYCRGRHFQSIWGYFLRARPRVVWRRERWDSPDGDFLDVDFLDADEPDAPTLLVLHGLEGSSDSHYVCGAAVRARTLGWRTLALNYRSCSGEPNRNPKFYHCGETGDLGFVAGRILERFGGPLVLAGFSLGGNVLLKWLGECGDGDVLSHKRGRLYFCELTARRVREGSRFRAGLFFQAAPAGQHEGKSGAFLGITPRPHRHRGR